MFLYADVIIPLRIAGTLTYSVPDNFSVRVGDRVTVPVGSKEYTGIVAVLHDETPKGNFEIKHILAVLDPEELAPSATQAQIRLWLWVAEYYMCPLGDVMRAAMPMRHRSGKKRKVSAPIPTPDTSSSLLSALPQLSPAQQIAYEAIVSDTHSITLLHGVTASGKTSIYMHLIRDVINRGGQVLYLVPEIALTTQLEKRMRAVFADEMMVYHSKMTDAQRNDVWEELLAQSTNKTASRKLVLGARSSVFLPFCNLQLVIIDEEHEASYKQQEPSPRYHARNVALMMARHSGARVLLGSATPSMESYYHTRFGRYGLVELNEKFVTDGSCDDTSSHRLLIEDVGELRRKKLMKGILAPRLQEEMSQALSEGHQIILFQNRRGWAPMVECKDCGWVPKCNHCDVSLTHHKRDSKLVCHTCGATYQVPSACPKCGSVSLRSMGIGTEKVVDEVHRLFPEARIARLDLDTAKTQDDFREIIEGFSQGDADVLVGTQMVTKGLDFINVSVVGVIGADTALNVPDFRAYERAYELIAQVAGRAGRKGLHSVVVIQTRQPDLPVIRHIVTGNYKAHYKDVMTERLEFIYPPFCRIIEVYFKHRYETTVEKVATDFCNTLTVRIWEWNHDVTNATKHAAVELLGPDAPAHARVSNLYIRKAVIKVGKDADLVSVKRYLNDLKWHYLLSSAGAGVSILYDVDPMN